MRHHAAEFVVCHLPACDISHPCLLVHLQAAAEGVNVRNVDREEVQQAVLATADFLRDNHECDHLWQRRHPPTSRNCHHCRHFEMYVYSYHCRICSMSVCNTCRFYRMQQ